MKRLLQPIIMNDDVSVRNVWIIIRSRQFVRRIIVFVFIFVIVEEVEPPEFQNPGSVFDIVGKI